MPAMTGSDKILSENSGSWEGDFLSASFYESKVRARTRGRFLRREDARGYRNCHVSFRFDSGLTAPSSAPSLSSNKRGVKWPDTMDRMLMVEVVAVQTSLTVFNIDPRGASTFVRVWGKVA